MPRTSFTILFHEVNSMRPRRFRFIQGLLLTLVLLLVESGCGDSLQPVRDPLDEKVISIATGGTTGPYFAIANGLADLINKNMPGYQSSVRSSGGGVENLELLIQGHSEMGFVMADIASFAYQEQMKSNEDTSLRTITSLYPNFVHVITLRNKAIRSIHDLKGKRVGVGDVGSGTEVNARTILQAYGLGYDDLEERHLSYKDSVAELEKGNIDAAFMTSGLPNKAVLELSRKGNLQFLPVSAAAIADIAKQYPYYYSDVIRKGTYAGQEDIPTAAITNLLLTRADLPDETVYATTKTLFEHLDGLKEAHLAAKDIRLEDCQKGVTVPFHPGAVQYFEEHGIQVLPLQTNQN